MKQRRLGKTGWDVSAVSMGCWAIGGQWGAVSEQQAIRTVHAALDAGVNLFDTADSYGLGQSETLLGKALADRRDEAYVATKVGNWARRQDDPPGLKSIYSIIGCCHASLYRLGMDTIDLYQCHVGSPEYPEIFVEAFELLKQQGKIRHYAISTNDVAALQALDVNGQCASCQINYSILNRTAERDILPYCRDHDIGVLLRGPIAQGLLTGKFDETTRFEDDVRASWNPGRPGAPDVPVQARRRVAVAQRPAAATEHAGHGPAVHAGPSGGDLSHSRHEEPRAGARQRVGRGRRARCRAARGHRHDLPAGGVALGAAASCAAVLDPSVGTWTSRIVLKPAAWTRQPRSYRAPP